ncbi:MAG: response regulator [Candidatus Omnitrophota bacterium]
MIAERRLLVVDDEKVVCDSCCRIFSGNGYNVDACTDPLEGLQLADRNVYSAILVDMKMPGVDGIEFLRSIREKHRDIPVMIITGYASVPSAAEAMRLGASDYIPKPFTPDEIVQAVERILAEDDDQDSRPMTLPEFAPAPSAAPPSASIPEYPEDADYLFWDESWMKLGRSAAERTDPLVQIGAFLYNPDDAAVRSIRLPQLGEAVFQGLPYFAYELEGESSRVVPSPITGVVVEINPELAANPAAFFGRSCWDGWIARVQVTEREKDLPALKPRNVILAACYERSWEAQRQWLRDDGCRLQEVRAYGELMEALFQDNSALLIFDAKSFDVSGPKIIRRINRQFPQVKIAVANDAEARMENAYRAHKILYYSAEPFSNREIKEILFSVYRPANRPAAAVDNSSPLPKWIGGLRVSFPQGRSAVLVSPQMVLREDRGLGLQLKRSVLEKGLPLAIDLCAGQVNVEAFLRDSQEDARVLILQTAEAGRLPGSIIRKEKILQASFHGEKAKSVNIYAIQPDWSQNEPLDFDDRLAKTLAEFFIREMNHGKDENE